MTPEIDGPVKAFRSESGVLEEAGRKVNRFRGNNRIYILSNHSFRRPVIDSHASDCAPCKIRTIETIDETHDIIRAVCQS